VVSRRVRNPRKEPCTAANFVQMKGLREARRRVVGSGCAVGGRVSDKVPGVSGLLLHLGPHERVLVMREGPGELVVEAMWSPGGSPPPRHLHPSQDEDFELRSGELVVIVGGQRRVLTAGEELHIPRGTPHSMWNASDQDAVALWRTRPCGRTPDWFATLDRLSEGGTRAPARSVLAKALAEHSDVFQLAVGPRPLRPLVGLALRVVAAPARLKRTPAAPRAAGRSSRSAR
jgi:quercetin dioxygenase-like cupin family protein